MRMLCEGPPPALLASASIAPRTSAIRPAPNETLYNCYYNLNTAASSVIRCFLTGKTIFDAEPGAIAVPVLVVSNEYDTCAETSPGDTPMVLSALTRAPRRSW
jgi:hypothetical protein